jgi:O-antigen/teichoic acid export membrane protein
MDEDPARRSGDEQTVMQTLSPGLDDPSARPASDQLAVRASSGLRWGAFNQGTQQVVRLGVQVVLTKLLAPSDFGAMALALVVINIGTLIGALGFAQALVQRQRITRRHVDVAFTTSGVVGALLMVVVFAGADTFAQWFNEPDLASLLRVLSIMFLLRGFEGVPNAMLVRQLYIRDFVLSSTIATVAGAAVGIAMAVAGAGLWSLAGMALTESFVATSLAWAFASRARVWSPRFATDRHVLSELLGFSAAASGTRMLLVAQGSIDSIVVGRQLGTDALGQYSLGYRFLFLPLDRLLDAIGGVLEPVLATLQDDRARFQDTLLRVERYVCSLYLPLTLGTAVVAQDLVLVVFGPEWLPAVAPLQILSLNGLRLALVRIHAYACESRGRPRAGLIVVGAQVALGAPASIIAARFGLIWVAVAFTVTGYIVMPLSFVFLDRITGVGPVRQFVALRGIFFASGAMVVIVLATHHALDSHIGRTTTLIVEVAVGVISYLGVLSLVDRSLLRSVLRDISRRHRGEQVPA